jgi:SAM-dependent methyltransferase
MKPDPAAVPDVMPLDRERWRQQLHLSNFVNAYYQYRDVVPLIEGLAAPRLLVIGPGQGLDTAVFRWKEMEVTTFDIDNTFKPDVLGSCHDMAMFGDAQFDVAIASHVMEHLPLPFLDMALSEVARVARHALIYLPVAGRANAMRLQLGFKGIDACATLDLLRFWERPRGDRPIYRAGQHYWEVGYRGFRVAQLCQRFERSFRVRQHYRNKHWLPSYNFVLDSRRHLSGPDSQA